jgi:hypothetical protein
MRLGVTTIALVAACLAGCDGGEEDNGGSVGGGSGSDGLTVAQREYVDWMRAFIELHSTEEEAVTAGAAVSRKIDANESVTDVFEATIEARENWERVAAEVTRSFPRPTSPAVARMNRSYRRGVHAEVRAHRTLASGLKLAPETRR